MPDTDDKLDILAGVPAIAAWYGFTESATRHRVAKGEIPTFRIGGTVCARRSTLLAWIAAQEANSRKSAPAPDRAA